MLSSFIGLGIDVGLADGALVVPPASLIGNGVRMPATTSSPCAFGSHSP